MRSTVRRPARSSDSLVSLHILSLSRLIKGYQIISQSALVLSLPMIVCGAFSKVSVQFSQSPVLLCDGWTSTVDLKKFFP
ncbi:hypothetical protein FA10DRAFT_269338 [Acaromyces ingoldii]|uniref:Uncharacterized protein n=1 Tax=Acaromyces ingoldii TaxID=215250 RepID=A0A316YGZ9_9BASI|nr:hypothetical protein FA10DRAFT_269338 [Acaromyces ingoldii]PWN87383.1 hypothetical protein FA10DRAFT_269338 [Acaromyces ingoldii]